ncbi:hypothetical protein [Thermosulfurimonas sp. F29]|uniref:hypothetical protein n=1 Tax=Thermosulfurimonas sp. F29 TaxID=2867247 RepID=UPI001C8286F6|nr:hypothetical protein [Thermosulfurimonas sp. F29]MBX6422394.1 hypothetical protein [Thermosulfurimonas sp. F29]
MEEKKIDELELEKEVEKALDDIFKGARKTELKEEEIEGYSLLEPVVEGEEAFKRDLEELVGEILTIEWEIIPEIAEKAADKCRRLQQYKLDSDNLKLIRLLENLLTEVRSPEKITAQKLEILKKAGDLLYKHNFENLEVSSEIADLEKGLKAAEQEEKELELELELETQEEVPREEVVPTVSPPSPVSPPSEEPRISVSPPSSSTRPPETENLISQLLKDYERLVALDELARLGRRKALRKLLLKAQNELRETLLRVDKKYEALLSKKEEEIRNFVASKESRKTVPEIKEAFWCRTSLRALLIPEDEVAFAGEIEDHWRPHLLEGIFPLRLLKGKGLWNSLFGKVRPKLRGSLSEKEEKELRKMVFKTNKLLTHESKLILLWKDNHSLALLVEDFRLVTLDSNLEWIPAEPPFLAKTRFEDEEVYLFSVTRA